MIKNLKKLRLGSGTTQQQLADVIMVSQQSVNKYENHNVEPDIDTLIKIADYFGVSVDYLVGRTDSVDLSASALNEEEFRILTLFRHLNQKQKKSIVSLLESYKG